MEISLVPSTRKIYVSSNKKNVYEYLTVKSLLNAKNMESVNLYGLVVECANPIFIERISKYLCVMELIDDSRHEGTLHVNLYAREAKTLPMGVCLGAIFRVHRGQTSKVRNTIQINCNVNVKGAWALFDPETGCTATSLSSSTYTFTENDKIRVAALRKFGREFFESESLKGISLIQPTETQISVLAKILKIKVKTNIAGEKLCYVKLCDPAGVAQMVLPIQSFPNSLSVSDLVRIAHVTVKKTEKSLLLNTGNYSGIMTIPSFHSTHKKFSELLLSKASDAVRLELLLSVPRERDSINLARITDDEGVCKISKLSDIFQKPEDKRLYKVRINILNITLPSSNSWIASRDSTQYYCAQFFVKDQSYPFDSKAYAIFLNSPVDSADSFFKNMTNPQLQNSIKKVLVMPWIFLEVMIKVEAIINYQPILVITNSYIYLP